jgi:predicted transcriptional regulator
VSSSSDTTIKPPVNLTAAQARTVLKANIAAIPDHTRALLRKVAANKPLTDRERGMLEGVIANAEVKARGRQFQTKPGERVSRREKDFMKALRRRRVLEARMRNLGIREIAQELGCDKNTVLSDLRALEDEFAAFAPTENRALLAQHIAELDVMIRENNALAARFTAPSAKAAFLRNAQQAMDQKQRLLENCGVIKKVPVSIVARRGSDVPSDGDAIVTGAKIVLLPALEEAAQ